MHWRTELPSWPNPWRRRWGEMANLLEEGGMPWERSEELAYHQVLEERSRGSDPPTTTPATEDELATEPSQRALFADVPGNSGTSTRSSRKTSEARRSS